MDTPNTTSVRKHPVRFASAIGALGIVFGDIGTSPLYAFKEPLRIAMRGGIGLHDAVFGVLSLIFWALTLTVSIKYICFIMRADNDGEGGVLALITGMKLHKNKSALNAELLTIGLSGAAMLFGDGVLTPAISVLSAIEGLEVVAPSLEHWVLQLTFIVLIAIFMSQRFGVEKIGFTYGPIMLVWFASIGLLGLHGILKDPSVLQAASPHHAVRILAAHPGMSAAIIGAVFLAVTGGEALFADMGHFGRGNIAYAWYFGAMPALLFNYFGQGALTVSSPQPVQNPFYELAPGWFGIPLLIIATLATVVAAQAMITGAFAIARQTIEVGYFPPMCMKGTSERNSQHIYIPRLSVALMTVCLGVVVLFPSSSQLAGAYGIAVSYAMLATSVLFAAWMLQKSAWPKGIVVPVCAAFVILDVAFTSTNMMKVFDGGWLPLCMGAFVLGCMLSWQRGVTGLIERHMGYTEPIEEFAARIKHAPLARVRHTGIFFSRTGIMTPVPLARLTDALHVRFDRMVIISIRISSRPRVDMTQRVVAEVVNEQVLKIELRYGYLQSINIPATIGSVLADHEIDADEALYIIGHERVIAPPEPSGLSDLMNVVFAFLAATAERSVDRFHLPPSRTLEIGYPVRMD